LKDIEGGAWDRGQRSEVGSQKGKERENRIEERGKREEK
jgi:hypothetical protein